MALLRMDNVGMVFEDLAAAIDFFLEIGLELEGQMPVEGPWVDRVVGLENVQVDIAMLRTPDGHSRLELMQFRNPAAIGAEHRAAPANALGLRRVMFAVTEIDALVARLIAKGATLMGDIAQYENVYRLCYLRGPEGMIVALAEKIGS